MGNEKIFVIGDIHGCAEELKTLLGKLPLTSNSRIVFVGDYIDRGENSREVISTIINLKNFYNVTTLMGNHESMLLDFLKDPNSMDAGAFIYNGGSATLASYAGPSGNYLIPSDHLDFFQKLPLFSQTEKFFFVHAGVPDVPLKNLIPVKHREDLLWIREPFFASKFKWEKLVIHGHTPVEVVERSSTRVNVDTGCVYDNLLSAYEVYSQEVFSVKKIKKVVPTYLRDVTSQRQAVRFEGVIPVRINISGQAVSFETINYSEIGMLVTSLAGSDVQILKEGDEVSGEITFPNNSPATWTGTVVRVNKSSDKFLYALRVTKVNIS